MNDFVALFAVFVPFLVCACLLYRGGKKIIRSRNFLKDYSIEAEEEKMLEVQYSNSLSVLSCDKKIEKLERKIQFWEMQKMIASDKIMHFMSSRMCTMLESKLKEVRQVRSAHFIVDRSLQIRLMEGYTRQLDKVNLYQGSRRTY